MVTRKIIVKGRVQGVNFRRYAKALADDLLIKGQIRNLADESVEIMATAEETIMQQFIDWCYEGPPAAQVQQVIVDELPLKWFDNFSIVKD